MSISMFKNINNMEIKGGVFRMENNMNEALERLQPSLKADYRAVLGDALKREECTPGTRVKILEDITKWANESSSGSPRVFWLTGQAGSGKTTIAYTITKRFGKGNADSLHTVLGGNFLCSRQFEETRELTRIVPTIVYQLARKCEAYASALHMAKSFDAVYYDVPTQLNDLIVGPWQQSTRSPELPLYLIVIDALDEIKLDGGSAFLRDLLTVIDEYNLRGFKFLVTSRPDPEVVTLCKSFTSEAVCWLQNVPIEEAESDIRTYLNAKLPKLHSSPELAELVRQSDGLFIYAATAVKYLTPHRSITGREQIRLLNNLVSKSHKPVPRNGATFLIDALYRQIVFDAFSNYEDELLTYRLRILHTFLCTAERTPISVVADLIAEGDDDVAQAVVEDLHAVLYTQDDRVYWYHGSFPDFIFDPARSNFDNFAFWCNEPTHHNLLGESCFRVMKSRLRFNMGDIESSFLFDTPALSEKVNNNISPVLRYSIRHWAHHLPSPQLINSDNLRFCISEFLQIRVLFWIETMNLLKLRHCTSILHRAYEWVLKCGNDYSELARDIGEAANFATYFTESPAAKSTPHLYISSLATWPQDRELCREWKRQFSRIPVFVHTKGRIDLQLMTIMTRAAANAVAFSRDGTRIVSGSDDKTVRVWDASTGAELNVLKNHTMSVNSVVFSRDGRWIVSGSSDRTVRVWDASTEAELNVLKGHTDLVKSVALSRDGRIVSGSYDKTVRVWNASTGAELRVLKAHADSVTSVAFSRDDMQIVSGSFDKTVRVWDSSTGAQLNVLKGHTNLVSSVAFSGDGKRIVSGSYDDTVRVWDLSTGAELNVLEGHTVWVNSVAFSRDGMRIVSGSYDKTVRVWDVSTGAELNVLKGHTNSVNSVAFSRDGMRIVSGSYDTTVRVWNVSTGAKSRVLKFHTSQVNSAVFSKDGMRIVSASGDKTLRVWDASTGEEVNVLRGHIKSVSSVAFSDRMRVVSGSHDMTVRVWDASTGAELNVLKGHTDMVNSVAFSRDGVRIVSGSDDGTVRIWYASKGSQLNVLYGHTKMVNSVAFSRDDMQIVSGSNDRTVRVWNASTGAELKVLEDTDSVTSVAYSNDSMRIVSGSRDGIRVWDALTGVKLDVLETKTNLVRRVASLRDPLPRRINSLPRLIDDDKYPDKVVDKGVVMSVAYSSDDMHIVSGSDKTVWVWDTSTAAFPDSLKGHTNSVNSVAFSPDGTRIVSCSSESIRVWDTSTIAKMNILKDPTNSANLVRFSRDFPWHLAQTGWITSVQEEVCLMWVPPEAQVIEPPTILVISRHGSGSVDFRQSMIGLEWAGCYTPD